MPKLRLEEYEMPSAGFGGGKNPLPPLHTLDPNVGGPKVAESISNQKSKYFSYGMINNCLPYRLQNDYDRSRKIKSFKVAVLENDILKATFLLEFGGRLWSLLYKPSNKQLLYKNPVFQPANFAIRNAWFSGGIEWNMWIPGHSPFTCSAPFFASLDNNGTTVLRMYEWERIRNAPYQVDFFLRDNSPLLFVRVKLINPNDFEIPAYWWSNIAIPEREGVRVLTPADYGYCSNLDPDNACVERMSVPKYKGKDITYPVNNVSAHDYFFHIPDGQRPWEAALDHNGQGLVHMSTSLLKGRKLFVWGMSSGGRRWVDFLSEPGNPYIEIQGGICRTQLECMPMAPGSELAWLEAYGLMEADPGVVHGDDWGMACHLVETKLEGMASEAFLEEELKRTEDMSNTSPSEIIQKGSGWGELEIKRRTKIAGEPLVNSALCFDDSLGPDQQPWLDLLMEGYLSEPSPEKDPDGYMTQTEWLQLLEDSIRKEKGNHWFSQLHLGVMYVAQKDLEKAKNAWLESVNKTENCWAYRNLALLYKDEGNFIKAEEMFKSAWELNRTLPELALEYGTLLLVSNKYDKLEKLLQSLDEFILKVPRIRLLKAHLCLENGNLSEVEEIIYNTELVDIREGEEILTDLWFDLKEKLSAKEEKGLLKVKPNEKLRKNHVPPESIDFRMQYNEI